MSGLHSVTKGAGQGQTPRIDVYDSETWPLRFIDTKGFEYSLPEQLMTIRQVNKYTKQQVHDGESKGIDIVRYCIGGTERRPFTHNIELMNKAVKGWKQIPVIAVITKSYSEPDINENIEGVHRAFERCKSSNLQRIIPVVAKAYPISDDVIVEPKGIEELCKATLDCAGLARTVNAENLQRMLLEQKRFTAHAMVATTPAAAADVGAIPVPFADSVILVPLELALVKGVLKPTM